MPKRVMTRTFPQSPGTVWETVKEALVNISASVAEEDEDRGWIRAYVSTNVWSWGEVIQVTVRPSQEEGTQVSVESKSRFPLTLADWGKNKRNVVEVMDHLQAVLS